MTEWLRQRSKSSDKKSLDKEGTANNGSQLRGRITEATPSLAGSGATALKLGPEYIILIGGVTGGVSSKISGGSFWDGLRQGLITSALNHVAHRVARSWSNGGDPANPKGPWSKETIEKLNSVADATGLPMDIIEAGFIAGSVGLDPKLISNTEVIVFRGIKILGAGTVAVSAASNFGLAYLDKENSSFYALKAISGIAIFKFAGPYAAITSTILDITGLSDPVYRFGGKVIDANINGAKSMPKTMHQIKTTTLNFQKLYR